MIAAGTNSSTINVTVIKDSLVEGNEMFIMNLTVSASISSGITVGPGAITMATATIIDANSRLHTS